MYYGKTGWKHQKKERWTVGRQIYGLWHRKRTAVCAFRLWAQLWGSKGETFPGKAFCGIAAGRIYGNCDVGACVPHGCAGMAGRGKADQKIFYLQKVQNRLWKTSAGTAGRRTVVRTGRADDGQRICPWRGTDAFHQLNEQYSFRAEPYIGLCVCPVSCGAGDVYLQETASGQKAAGNSESYAAGETDPASVWPDGYL